MDEKVRQEIALLQTQVNPHFLYNTLSAIKTMALNQGAPAVADMASRLSALLRALARNTDVNSPCLIPLSEELAILDNYSEIMAVRFMGSFTLEKEIDPRTEEALVPRLCLQPLVENALLHGFERASRFGLVKIKSWYEEECLLISVCDNGRGMDAETLANILKKKGKSTKPGFTRMGIANVDRRIKLIFGKGSGLSYASTPGQGTCVMIKMKKLSEND
jgi:two-component system sensor histidine kinase YesM